MDWTKSVGRGLHSQLVWACKLVARTGQNRGRLPVRSPASRRRSELLPSTFWQAAPPWRKGLVLPSAHARVANEGLGLQTTKNLLGTSELNWAAVTGAGARLQPACQGSLVSYMPLALAQKTGRLATHECGTA